MGGQVGAELTEFVFILNTPDAVKAFSHGGNVTLGGNLSVALVGADGTCHIHVLVSSHV